MYGNHANRTLAFLRGRRRRRSRRIGFNDSGVKWERNEFAAPSCAPCTRLCTTPNIKQFRINIWDGNHRLEWDIVDHFSVSVLRSGSIKGERLFMEELSGSKHAALDTFGRLYLHSQHWQLWTRLNLKVRRVKLLP